MYTFLHTTSPLYCTEVFFRSTLFHFVHCNCDRNVATKSHEDQNKVQLNYKNKDIFLGLTSLSVKLHVLLTTSSEQISLAMPV